MRPRKAQIDNLKTNYSELVLQPTVGATSASIIPADLYNYTITDTDGGVEEDIPARTVANPIAPPYLISLGDSFSVRLNGAPSITVTFAASDTNISRIVDKINLTLGVAIAFNKNGYLLLQSNVIGDNSQLILNDVVVGTLTKLGLSAGTYNGASEPIRGIVTKSNQVDDNGSDLGGFVPLKTLDQKSIISDSQYLRKVNTNSINGTLYTSDAPIGIPINGRINSVGGIYIIKFHTRGPGPAELITSSSSFSSLDGTDSFNLTFSTVNYDGSSRNLVSTIVSGITFPAAPYTRDSVIQRINQVVASTINPNGAGAARVIGRNRQPFNVNGLTLKMAIDGGGVVAYTFGSITTAFEIAVAITANFPGVTATPASGGTQIQITSNNINGYSSSIEIIGGDQSNPVANILGIQPGLYRGLWVAEPYGYDEIRLATWVHGYSSLLGVSGLSQTLTRLGLSNTIVHGSDNKERLVTYPKVSTGQVKILTVVPEVIDLRESRDNTESINAKFNNQSLSNNDYFNQVIDISQPPSNNWFSSANGGVRTAGKPVLTNLSGQIDRDYLRNALDEIYSLVKQFTNGTYIPGSPSVDTVGGGYINGLFQSLVASRLLTNDIREYSPGSITNININFSPDLATASGHYHESRVTVGVNVTSTNIISKLRWEYDGISTVDTDLKIIHDLGFASNKSAFGSSSGECNFFDSNTISSGTLTGGKKYIPLTSPWHQYTRISEQYNNTGSDVSILKTINSRYSITIGDGTNTWGDFNGPSALQNALTSALASGAVDIVIDVKPGTYTLSSSVNFASAPANLKLTLNGKGQSTIIDFGVEAFYFYNTQTIILNNIYLYCNNQNLAITLYNNASVIANNITSRNVAWTINGVSNVTINDSVLTANPTGILFWFNIPGNIPSVGSSGLHVYNSFLTGGTILYIQNISNSTPKTRFEKIIFRDCKIDLTGESTIVASSLSTARGLIQISATTNNGFYIDSLAFYNCNVTQKTGSVYGTVIYLTPNRSNLEDTNYFDINTITIDGGTWLAPYTDQTMNPFTIVSNHDIFIRNIKFGFFEFGGGQTHGGPILQHEKWFANGTSGSPVLTASMWGMLAVRADYLEMDNIVLNTNRNSNSGDLFVFTPENGTSKLNNINIVVNTDAGGSNPTNRIRLRNYNPLLVEIDKLLFRSIDSASIGTNILYAEPNGYASETELSITNSNFSLPGGGTPADAIYLAGVSSIGNIYTSSPRDFTNVTLSSNKITRCQNGIEVGTGNSSQVFSNINIENNIINSCDSSAIYFRICNGRNFNFINNILSQNAAYGIYIEDGVNATHSLSYNIMNNRCSSNGGYNGIQIRLRLLDPSSFTYKMVDSIIMGNNCCDTGDGSYAYDTPSTWGKIKINQITANVAAALTSPTNHINSPKGAHTGFSSTVDNVLKFDTSDPMALNQATLETP